MELCEEVVLVEEIEVWIREFVSEKAKRFSLNNGQDGFQGSACDANAIRIGDSVA
jgi:hypothetical protein